MSPPARTVQWAVWGFLGLVILGIAAAYISQGTRSVPLPAYQKIGDFSLMSQNEAPVALKDLKGKVWVGNIIFTRCAGPCMKLTRQMREIQEALPAPAAVRFISLTADPVFDTPETLRRYADRFQADHHRWFFLTGNKAEVYRLAVDDLKFTVLDDERDRKPDEDLFIHSSKFVVVDGSGHVRAYVDGDEPETVVKVTSAVTSLLKERRQ